MANTLLAKEERNLTPEEVGALDERRRRGFMLMVVSVQFAIVAVVLLLWIGQDLTYSPGWAHPTFYYFLFAVLTSIVTGISGKVLRRGAPEF